MNLWKKARILIKLGLIGLLTVLLLVPLYMIFSLIAERQSYRQHAISELAQGWAENQEIKGPYLVIRYRVKGSEKTWDENLKKYYQKPVMQSRVLLLPPEKLVANVDLPVELRYRGIYRVPVYSATGNFEASFKIPKHLGLEESVEIADWQKPLLVMGISDVRGIASIPVIQGFKEPVSFQPGSNMVDGGPGIHAWLPEMNPQEPHDFSLRFNLKVLGMSSFNLVPVGRDTSFSLKSNWPHPGFSGRFPVSERTIDENGFSATWQLSHFATDLPAYFEGKKDSLGDLSNLSVGARLVDPVDVYTQTERATKYGILFIALTFAAFFLFEVIKKLSIHPVQYCLVGAALALFFLLVLALSEHLAFSKAYAIATGCSVGLIGFYLCFVLKGFWRGAGFASLLGALYGVLYVLLRSEDYALLMGSALLFGMLALVMVVTRQINWYAVETVEESGVLPPPLKQ